MFVYSMIIKKNYMNWKKNCKKTFAHFVHSRLHQVTQLWSQSQSQTRVSCISKDISLSCGCHRIALKDVLFWLWNQKCYGCFMLHTQSFNKFGTFDSNATKRPHTVANNSYYFHIRKSIATPDGPLILILRLNLPQIIESTHPPNRNSVHLVVQYVSIDQ